MNIGCWYKNGMSSFPKQLVTFTTSVYDILLTPRSFLEGTIMITGKICIDAGKSKVIGSLTLVHLFCSENVWSLVGHSSFRQSSN